MALNIYEQIMEYIKAAEKIVIALPSRQSADSLGAAYVLCELLRSINKTYQTTIEEERASFDFLKEGLNIAPSFKQARRLVITLDITEQGLEKFYYTTNEENHKLEIFVVPKTGFFNPDDVRVGQGGFEYDLIITIGASDFQSLGALYNNNTAFFHETPIINIDHKASNEKYGEINLIEPTKSSVSEIIFDFICANFPDIINKKVATALLTGILEKTESFRAPTLAPQTLEKASKLMTYEADRELVVRELFYNKSLNLVKLWGRVLARLKEDKAKNLYWSLINTDDYTRAGASPQIIDQVFKEVLSYLPKDAVVLLFSEYNSAVLVLAYSGNREINLEDRLHEHKLTSFDQGVSFKVWNKDLLELEQEVMQLFEIKN